MAIFQHDKSEIGSQPLTYTMQGRVANLHPNGNMTAAFAKADVTLTLENGTTRQYQSERGIISILDGVKVLPYGFWEGAWHVVMVEQFRVALPGATLEPPGGGLDSADIRKKMTEELAEEAHILLEPQRIRMVYSAYVQPSVMAAKAHGGIVEIQHAELPENLLAGEQHKGEYTVVCVRPLRELWTARGTGKWIPDLETWLLLDAVRYATDQQTEFGFR